MHPRLTESLAQVGLSGFEGRDPTTLSGGQKQRLAIAALLALRPRILVFDEPTTDLDPEGRQEIFALLGQMRKQGHTLVVVEHEVTAAAGTADRLLILADGEVVADGPPVELLPRVDILERYGIKPHDCDRLFPVLGVHEYPRDVAAAAALLQKSTPASPVGISAAARERPEQRTSITLITTSRIPTLTVQPRYERFAHIGAGEFIALLGKNGSGKTTLAKHSAGCSCRPRVVCFYGIKN